MPGNNRFVSTFTNELTLSLNILKEAASREIDPSILGETYVQRYIKNIITAFDEIKRKYNDLGGAPGQPINEMKYGGNHGFYREYEVGSIYWHVDTGAHWVYGRIYQRYLQLGGSEGFLGYPTTDETGSSDAFGRFNHFQNGSIYWSPHTDAWEIHGDIRAKWFYHSAEIGLLGYPLSDETTTANGTGRCSHFQNGSIYWSAETGAYELHGPILDMWKNLGGVGSYLGCPTSDVDEWRDTTQHFLGRIALFQRGRIILSKDDNRVTDLPNSVVLYSGPLNTPAPIMAWAELMLDSAGHLVYRGHAHNSGFIGYDFTIASVLHFNTSSGQVIAVAEENHIGGTSSGEDRDHDWEKICFVPEIRDSWEDLKNGVGMTTQLVVGVGFEDVVSAIAYTLSIAGVIAMGYLLIGTIFAGSKVCPSITTEEYDPVTGEYRPVSSNPIVPNDQPCPQGKI